MIEKQFKLSSETVLQYQIMDNDTDLNESEVVDLLNEKESRINTLVKENEQLKKENNDYEKQFRIINEKLDEYIKTADTYRIPISSLKYGDDLGYFNGVHQYMKKLKKDIEGLDMSEKQFVLYEHKGDYYILKNPRLHLDFIEMLGDALTSEEIVEELNQLNDKVVELAEKNEQLKNYFKKRAECSNFQINKLKEDYKNATETYTNIISNLQEEIKTLRSDEI